MSVGNVVDHTDTSVSNTETVTSFGTSRTASLPSEGTTSGVIFIVTEGVVASRLSNAIKGYLEQYKLLETRPFPQERTSCDRN